MSSRRSSVSGNSARKLSSSSEKDTTAAAAATASPAAQSERKSSGTGSKDKQVSKSSLQFADLDSAMLAAERDDRDRIYLIGLGAEWLYPSLKSMEALQKYRAEGVVTVVVDAESHNEFCEQSGIVAGSPVCFIYFKGRRLWVKRGSADSTAKYPFLSAQLSTDRLDRLVAAVRQSRQQQLKDPATDADYFIIDF